MSNTTFDQEPRTATKSYAYKVPERTEAPASIDGITYLATPYSHPCERVREQRFHDANWCAAFLMKNLDLIVFSPISHSHAIATGHDMPTDWEFWKRQDEAILERCRNMVVFTQDGWDQSVGVKAEIEKARSLGIPIDYLSPGTLMVMESIADALS